MSIKTYEERLVGLRPLQTYVPEHLLRAEIAELRAALERKNDDAERYRWLRKQDWFDSTLCVLRDPKTVLTRGPQLGADCPSGTRLEAMNDDLRDHFAGLAMQGLIAQSIGTAITSGDFPLGASWSYQMADAMMEARKK